MRRIRQTVTTLYPNDPTGEKPYKEESTHFQFYLLPFYGTDKGFAELRRKLCKALSEQGHRVLTMSCPPLQPGGHAKPTKYFLRSDFPV